MAPQQPNPGERWVDLGGGVQFNTGVFDHFYWPWNLPPAPTPTALPPGNWQKLWGSPWEGSQSWEVHINRDTWDNMIDVDKAWNNMSTMVRNNVTVNWDTVDQLTAIPGVLWDGFTSWVGRNITFHRDTFDRMKRDAEEILKAIDPYRLDLDDPRKDWTRFMTEWEELLAKLERKIAELRSGTQNSVAQRLLQTAADIVADVKSLVQEAKIVPIAILDDMDVWRGKWSGGTEPEDEVRVIVPGIQADATWIENRTTVRAIDSEMEAQGLAASKPWKGRVREAYVGAIPGQNAAVGQLVIRLADQTVISLGAVLVAAGTKYASYALLLLQVLMLLARFVVLDMKVLVDSGEYATLTRLWISTKLADGVAVTSVKVQEEKLKAIVAARPGLSQRDQRSPNSGSGVDRRWPNPFTNVNFMRAEIVNGKVRLDGGAKLEINKHRFFGD